MISPAIAGDLTILHMNDHHSHLQADEGVDLRLAGQTTRVRSGGFPALIAKTKALLAGRDDIVKLHAGDAITGDLYYTLFKGAADAALMNELCFDAFALGNHEFDDGDAVLAYLKLFHAALSLTLRHLPSDRGFSPSGLSPVLGKPLENITNAFIRFCSVS